MEPLALLGSTIALRPYVFVFLLVYLIGCSMHLGIKRSLLFLVCGYLIAWLSEYSSIHNGIPYGHYSYIDTTRDSELWVLGVPFMDSLSYVFLAYASYSMALSVRSPLLYSQGAIHLLETREIRGSLSTTMLGALCFMYLDVIIDPIALRGDKWFLGQIYAYPGGGAYFGVPISNFLGWAAVGFIMILALQTIDEALRRKNVKDWYGSGYPWKFLVGPVLYLGVIVFNLFIAFYAGEFSIGWAGVFVSLAPAVLIYHLTKLKLSSAPHADLLKAHYKDFPDAPGWGEE